VKKKDNMTSIYCLSRIRTQLISLAVIIFSLLLIGCENKHIKEVDTNIAYFDTKLKILDQKLDNFNPELYDLDDALKRTDELSNEVSTLNHEILNYMDQLSTKTLNDLKTDYYTEEQWDKLKEKSDKAVMYIDRVQDFLMRLRTKLLRMQM
jgi:outer membrane murein-binding lipoprotein Lpp